MTGTKKKKLFLELHRNLKQSNKNNYLTSLKLVLSHYNAHYPGYKDIEKFATKV